MLITKKCTPCLDPLEESWSNPEPWNKDPQKRLITWKASMQLRKEEASEKSSQKTARKEHQRNRGNSMT